MKITNNCHSKCVQIQGHSVKALAQLPKAQRGLNEENDGKRQTMVAFNRINKNKIILSKKNDFKNAAI